MGFEEVKHEIEEKLSLWGKGLRYVDYCELLRKIGIDARLGRFVAIRSYAVKDNVIEICITIYTTLRLGIALTLDIGKRKAKVVCTVMMPGGYIPFIDSREIEIEENEVASILDVMGLTDVYRILKSNNLL